MSPQIESFVQSKSKAVIGFTRMGKKYGNMAGKEFIKRGYEVFPVYPEVQEIDAAKCYPNLKSLDGKAEALLICIPPTGVSAVLEEVSKKCNRMYAPPVTSIHNFHRTLHLYLEDCK